MHRRLAVLVVVPLALLLAGCGGATHEGAQEALAVSSLRAAATAAGSSPTACPVHFDVAAALKAGGLDQTATAGQVRVEVSTSATAAADPVAARRNGMSVLDSAAAVFLRCQYAVGGSTLDLDLVGSPEPKVAAAILAPAMQQLGELTEEQVLPLAASPPAPGAATLAGTGTLALARIKVASGDAALVLSGGGLSGDGLVAAAQDLARQAAQS